MDYLTGNTRLDQAQALRLNPTQWAYIGDTVYDLFVRTHLLVKTDYAVGKMHRMSVSQVNCRSQAAAGALIAPLLTPQEADVLRRGRNAKTHAAPKNADPADYAQATALEALIGYLYLTGQDARIEELMQVILSSNNR